jgi:hypothetical protein
MNRNLIYAIGKEDNDVTTIAIWNPITIVVSCLSFKKWRKKCKNETNGLNCEVIRASQQQKSISYRSNTSLIGQRKSIFPIRHATLLRKSRSANISS